MKNTSSLFAEQAENARSLAVADQDVQFDYESETGNKAARSYVHSIRRAKGALESARKKEKAEILARGRAIDAEAKDVSGVLDGIIERHDGPIKAIERREAERVAAIDDDIAELRSLAEITLEQGSVLNVAGIEAKLSRLRGQNITEDRYQERYAEALRIQAAGIETLEAALKVAIDAEAERAELDRLRAAEAERERVEQARIRREAAEREAALRQSREAQAAKEAAERQAAEALAAAARAEQAAAEAKRREAEAAAQGQRREAEAAERARQAEIARAAEEKRQAEEAQRQREADAEHKARVRAEAKQSLETLGIAPNIADSVISAIDSGDVAHVSINY